MTAIPDGLIPIVRSHVRAWWVGCPKCNGTEVHRHGDSLVCDGCGWNGKSAAELVRLREDANAGRYRG